MKNQLPVTLLLVMGMAACADEVPNHSLLDLPPTVKSMIQRQAGDNSIGSIERGILDGRTVYYVRVEQPGIDKRVTIAADGSLLKVSNYEEVNKAITASKEAGQGAWSKTKEVASDTWSATKDTVRKATASFRSDELTLNQIPERPRATMEREAAGNRLTDLKAESSPDHLLYWATIRLPDGSKRSIVVREDGSLGAVP